MTDSIYINQTTQDLDVDSKGNIVNANSLLTEIYARLNCLLGSLRYNKGLGSVLPLLVKTRKKITINELKNAVINALLPMVNRGAIINIDFILIALGIGYFNIVLNVTDSNSNTFSLPYSVQG